MPRGFILPYRVAAAKRLNESTEQLIRSIAEFLDICDVQYERGANLDGERSGRESLLIRGRQQLYFFLVEKLRPHLPGGDWPARLRGDARSTYDKRFNEIQETILRSTFKRLGIYQEEQENDHKQIEQLN